MELSESELKAVQNGNNSSFERLIDCYQDRMYGLAFKMIRDKEDAQEITQVAFIKCYQNIKSFAFNSKFSVWLYSITYHESLSFLKKNKRWVYGHFENDYQQQGHAPEVEAVFIEKERKETVKNLLDNLKTDERLLLNLFYLEELSYKEITKITGFTLSNVKVKIHRAKNKLKKNINYSIN